MYHDDGVLRVMLVVDNVGSFVEWIERERRRAAAAEYSPGAITYNSRRALRVYPPLRRWDFAHRYARDPKQREQAAIEYAL
jgi:hypothetical protein